MRAVRIATLTVSVVAIAVALAAFRLQSGQEAPEGTSPTTMALTPLVEVAPPPIVAVEPLPMAEPAAVQDAPEPPARQPTTQTPPERERRPGWSRNRNRYPGPIPTPADWEPPPAPVRIALQAGHWRANEAPSELSGLRDNGTSWEGVKEWEVNLQIARSTGAMLEKLGYEVDILPAVVPPDYRAHLFVAIHADGSNNPGASGFRVAAPRRDATGRASQAVEILERTYAEATGLRRLPDVTRRMSSYYAFNYRRYEHALHPMTIGLILETGFLTSPSDREVILNDPDRAARGIVEAIMAFPETPPPDVLTRSATSTTGDP